MKAVPTASDHRSQRSCRTRCPRGGLFTDYANSPKNSSGRINQLEHIDLYGGTFSLSRITRNTAVTLGGGYTYGESKAQVMTNSANIQTAVAQGWMFFLSSSFSY